MQPRKRNKAATSQPKVTKATVPSASGTTASLSTATADDSSELTIPLAQPLKPPLGRPPNKDKGVNPTVTKTGADKQQVKRPKGRPPKHAQQAATAQADQANSQGRQITMPPVLPAQKTAQLAPVSAPASGSKTARSNQQGAATKSKAAAVAGRKRGNNEVYMHTQDAEPCQPSHEKQHTSAGNLPPAGPGVEPTVGTQGRATAHSAPLEVAHIEGVHKNAAQPVNDNSANPGNVQASMDVRILAAEKLARKAARVVQTSLARVDNHLAYLKARASVQTRECQTDIAVPQGTAGCQTDVIPVPCKPQHKAADCQTEKAAGQCTTLACQTDISVIPNGTSSAACPVQGKTTCAAECQTERNIDATVQSTAACQADTTSKPVETHDNSCQTERTQRRSLECQTDMFGAPTEGQIQQVAPSSKEQLLAQQVEQLTSQLHDRQNDVQRLRREAEAAVQEKQAAQQAVTRYLEEAGRCRQQTDTLTEELHDSRAQQRAQRLQLDFLQAQLDSEGAAAYQLRQAQEELQSQVEALNAQLLVKQQQIDRFARQKAANVAAAILHQQPAAPVAPVVDPSDAGMGEGPDAAAHAHLNTQHIHALGEQAQLSEATVLAIAMQAAEADLEMYQQQLQEAAQLEAELRQQIAQLQQELEVDSGAPDGAPSVLELLGQLKAADKIREDLQQQVYELEAELSQSRGRMQGLLVEVHQVQCLQHEVQALRMANRALQHELQDRLLYLHHRSHPMEPGGPMAMYHSPDPLLLLRGAPSGSYHAPAPMSVGPAGYARLPEPGLTRATRHASLDEGLVEYGRAADSRYNPPPAELGRPPAVDEEDYRSDRRGSIGGQPSQKPHMPVWHPGAARQRRASLTGVSYLDSQDNQQADRWRNAGGVVQRPPFNSRGRREHAIADRSAEHQQGGNHTDHELRQTASLDGQRHPSSTQNRSSPDDYAPARPNLDPVLQRTTNEAFQHLPPPSGHHARPPPPTSYNAAPFPLNATSGYDPHHHQRTNNSRMQPASAVQQHPDNSHIPGGSPSTAQPAVGRYPQSNGQPVLSSEDAGRASRGQMPGATADGRRQSF